MILFFLRYNNINCLFICVRTCERNSNSLNFSYPYMSDSVNYILKGFSKKGLYNLLLPYFDPAPNLNR